TVTDPAGNVSYTSVGILKYTTAPTAVITNTPQINDQQLDIRIEGVGVTHYRYKIGDDEMECGPYSSGYSSPASVLEAIDDDLEDDGDKKICVVGIDTYGNAQAFSSATSYVWEKDTTVPITVSFTAPAPNTRINSVNMSSFNVTGTCLNNGANLVTVTGVFGTQTIDCTDNNWSVSLDLTALPNGPVQVNIAHASANISRTFQKYVSMPAISFTTPA